MDPTAAVNRLFEAMRREDRTNVAEAARDLADWLDKGGFWPVTEHWISALPTRHAAQYLRDIQTVAEMV